MNESNDTLCEPLGAPQHRVRDGGRYLPIRPDIHERFRALVARVDSIPLAELGPPQPDMFWDLYAVPVTRKGHHHAH